MSPFRQQLARARFASGLSQKAAAQALGVSQSSFEKWECGTRTPRPLLQEALLAKMEKIVATQNPNQATH